MFLFIYYTDKRDTPRKERHTVAQVEGGIAECSVVYRRALSLVDSDPELGHVDQITSMSTVPVFNGEVDEVFSSSDVTLLRMEEALQ